MFSGGWLLGSKLQSSDGKDFAVVHHASAFDSFISVSYPYYILLPELLSYITWTNAGWVLSEDTLLVPPGSDVYCPSQFQSSIETIGCTTTQARAKYESILAEGGWEYVSVNAF